MYAHALFLESAVVEVEVNHCKNAVGKTSPCPSLCPWKGLKANTQHILERQVLLFGMKECFIVSRVSSNAPAAIRVIVGATGQHYCFIPDESCMAKPGLLYHLHDALRTEANRESDPQQHDRMPHIWYTDSNHGSIRIRQDDFTQLSGWEDHV